MGRCKSAPPHTFALERKPAYPTAGSHNYKRELRMDGLLPALTDYRPIRYSHIKIAPGEDYVLTADPWSYLYSYLRNDLDGRRGINRKNRERAIFYLGLAQNFYRASEAAELPAKATLLYYGMLNLVKVWISIRGVGLETRIEHHGVSLTLGNNAVAEVQTQSQNNISIFAEFAKALGKPVASKNSVTLRDAIAQVPELHSAWKRISTTSKQHFIAVDIDFLTDPEHKKLVSVMAYNKKTEGLINNQKIYRGARKAYFNKPEVRGDQVCLLSKTVRRPTNWKNISISYRRFLQEYDQFDLCSILTRGGYRHFVNLEPREYHHLSYTLLVMFCLGTAARYRPTMMNEVLNGDLRQSVTEACAICPRQFLYQLACRITSSECVIPYAEI